MKKHFTYGQFAIAVLLVCVALGWRKSSLDAHRASVEQLAGNGVRFSNPSVRYSLPESVARKLGDATKLTTYRDIWITEFDDKVKRGLPDLIGVDDVIVQSCHVSSGLLNSLPRGISEVYFVDCVIADDIDFKSLDSVREFSFTKMNIDRTQVERLCKSKWKLRVSLAETRVDADDLQHLRQEYPGVSFSYLQRVNEQSHRVTLMNTWRTFSRHSINRMSREMP
ncbi:MAG: hypothetical protein AAF497_15415 [Planctomycetota bacterium]